MINQSASRTTTNARALLREATNFHVEKLRALSYPAYLRTQHWRNIRQVALIRSGYKCAVCGCRFNLECHHNTYKTLGHERQCDVVILCRPCHTLFHQHRGLA